MKIKIILIVLLAPLVSYVCGMQESNQDLYVLLGLNQTAQADDISHSFRYYTQVYLQQSMQLPFEVNEKREEHYENIKFAHDILIDPLERHFYDTGGLVKVEAFRRQKKINEGKLQKNGSENVPRKIVPQEAVCLSDELQEYFPSMGQKEVTKQEQFKESESLLRQGNLSAKMQLSANLTFLFEKLNLEKKSTALNKHLLEMHPYFILGLNYIHEPLDRQNIKERIGEMYLSYSMKMVTLKVYHKAQSIIDLALNNYDLSEDIKKKFFLLNEEIALLNE